MYNAFIRSGHGYEVSDRGRCTAFDGFDVVAAPLHQEGKDWEAAFGDKARESRIFRRANGNGTDYGSHAIALARMSGDSSGALYILMHNGSGREVLAVPTFYDGGDLAAHITSLPERLQYALLYTIWSTANNARYEAMQKTGARWATAFSEKRIRQRRAARGRPARVEIIEEWERKREG